MGPVDKTPIYLSQNIIKLREKKNLTQQKLAQISGIPRSTLTNVESGEGNPSINNLVKISTALGVGIEELLSRPRSDCLLVKSKDVPVFSRSHGRVNIHKLLPDKIKGIEIDRMEIAAESSMGGHPHLEGTKEYLITLQGEIEVHVAGEKYQVKQGDIFAFPGNQPHSYRNNKRTQSVAISIVIPVPLFL